MKQMKVLSLPEVTRENWRATLGLTVFPEQQKFIAEYVPINVVPGTYDPNAQPVTNNPNAVSGTNDYNTQPGTYDTQPQPYPANIQGAQ